MSPRRRGRTETEHQGLFWGWADSPRLAEPQKAEFIIHPQTPGLPAWAPSLAAPVLIGSKEGWQVGREGGGWSSLGQQGRVSQGTDSTAGPCCYLSANAKELLLEQENLSCNDRVNFKLAESFWDFFSSTVKSLGLEVANYNNMRWQSHEEWWMAKQGWKSRRSDHNEL